MFNCDLDNSDSVCGRELYRCLVAAENEWRADYCPEECETLYCNDGWLQIDDGNCVCEGSKNCATVE
jgi:hypothetical protein